MSKQQYLEAMGIDVWSLRTAAATPVPSPPPPDKPAREAATPATHVPEFRFALLHYESVGLCLSLDQDAPLPRRLCDDIARVAGGNVDNARYHQLQWPMLNTAGVDQSVAAARDVVAHKLSLLPARVIVFGDDVADYFNPLKAITPLTPSRVGERSFLLIPSLAGLMHSAAAKRELMQALYGWPADGSL